jgi:ketosteroid isomerase-like protein
MKYLFTGGFMKSLCIAFMLIFCFVLTIRAEDWNKVKQTIEEMNNKMEKELVEGNVEQLITYYTEDAISLPGFEPACRGIAEIKQKAEEHNQQGFKVTSADFKTTDVIGSGDIAVEVGEWNMTITMPGSGSPMNDTGKYVTVWQKQADDSWKIKVETWNTNSNPMMMSEGAGTTTDEMK